jgi:hypothetical protein
MRVVAVGMLILALAGPAWAAPVTLNAQALRDTPGVVAIDGQNETVVSFCDDVRWMTFKAPWLHAQISRYDRRVLLLDAASQSGTAALSVWLEGQGAPLQLLVRVSPTALENHLYFVSCGAQAAARAGQETSAPSHAVAAPAAQAADRPAQPSAHQAPAAGPAPAGDAAAWDAFVPTLSARQWQFLQALIASPNADAYAAFTASLSPDQAAVWSRLAPAAHLTPPGAQQGPAQGAAATESAPPSQPAPAWLVFQTSVVAPRGGGGVLVPYTVTNTGTVEVVLDAVRLQVLDANGAPVRGVRVARHDTSGFDGRVPPGGAESGTIALPAGVQGVIAIRWPAVAIAESEAGISTYALSQDVRIP